MDKTIIVDISLFTLKSPVFLIQGKNQSLLGTYSKEELPEVIVTACENYEVKNVKIHGSPTYLAPIVEDVKKQEIKKYSKNFINIEVI